MILNPLKLFIFVGLVFLGVNLVFATTPVEDLNNQIQQGKDKLESIQKKIDEYQKVITARQAEASTLKRQLLVLDDKIAQAELDLKANELNLQNVTLQIEGLTLEIEEKDLKLEDAKSKTAEIIRQINLSDQHSVLEILILNPTLSDFFEEVNYLEQLQDTLQTNINKLQSLKTELEIKEKSLANEKIKLLDIKNELDLSKSLLQNSYETKNIILKQTRSSESRYQDLLSQMVAEQRQASGEIAKLESELRKKLSEIPNAIDRLNDTNFIWSINNLGITAYFHDPSYPFRRYFEHPAIDIRARQGTLIKAAATGYVGRAKDAGQGYSYIMLIHAENFSTVYGHVSRIDVQEGDYVTKGQIIGATGGTPGTRGAGPLTTGPHLHFEIRYNGLPVNPLDYLP